MTKFFVFNGHGNYSDTFAWDNGISMNIENPTLHTLSEVELFEDLNKIPKMGECMEWFTNTYGGSRNATIIVAADSLEMATQLALDYQDTYPVVDYVDDSPEEESIVSIEETDTIENLIKKWGLDPKNPNWEIDSIGRLKGSSRKYIRNTYKCFLSNFDGNNPSRHGEMYKNISSQMGESYIYKDCDFKELTDNYSGVVSGCKVEKIGEYFVVTSTNTCFTNSTGIKAKALLFWSKKPIEIKVEIFGNPERHSRGKIVFSSL
jgi:hypothetical protein